MGKRLEQQNTVEALNGDRNALLSLLLFFNKNLNPRKKTTVEKHWKSYEIIIIIITITIIIITCSWARQKSLRSESHVNVSTL